EPAMREFRTAENRPWLGPGRRIISCGHCPRAPHAPEGWSPRSGGALTMRKTLLALAVLVVVTTAPARAQGWAEKRFKGNLSHDFGTVARGAQLTHIFTITNIYAVRMEVTSIKSGCGCVTATAAKRVLEPRESTTVEVRMDGKRFSGPK